MGLCQSSTATETARSHKPKPSPASVPSSASSPAAAAAAAPPPAPPSATTRAVEINEPSKRTNLPPPPSSAAATKKADPTVDEVMDSGLAKVAEGHPSVVDKAKKFQSMLQRPSGAMAGAHHLQNIFAVPLEQMDDYSAPVNPKSSQEEDFIRRAILQNFVFSNLTSKEVDVLIGAFEKDQVSNGDLIIKQGDVGDYFYVLVKGSVEYDINGKFVGSTELSGQTFGELALLYSAPRAASVKATADCQLFRVDQKTFRYILQQQTKETDKNKRNLLRGVDFLKDLDDTDLSKLIGALVPRAFTKGELLVKKGEEGDVFYVIQEGSVLVKDIVVGNRKYENQVLNEGDYFGERALVTHEPRAANVVAQGNGIALTIDSDTFEKVMGSFKRLVLKATDKRTLTAMKVFEETDVGPIELAALADLIQDDHYREGHTILEEGYQTEAALYIVREGKVLLSSGATGKTKVIEQGGCFGDEMLTADAALEIGQSPKEPIVLASYSVTVLEDVTLGSLTLGECRSIIDTTTIGKGRQRRKSQQGSALHSSITAEREMLLKDLEKHKILGAGTFGQVWLVSRTTPDGMKRPYALKVQSKYELIKSHQAKGVVQERRIMAHLHHPFIIELVKTFQDKHRVYMVLALIQGGELFGVIHTSRFDGVPEKHAKFYSAAIIEGLTYMHKRNILYRDLKPENVLIDGEGYPTIVDLGFAKHVTSKTYTLCGTPLYIAPEVVLNRGHDKGADHWSWGILTYEMMAGYTPFYKEGMDQIALFRALCKGDYRFPRDGSVGLEAQDLLRRVLVTSPSQRLGSLARGSKDIYRHAWFADVNFDALRNKEVRSPWRPKLKDPLDCPNFENWDHLEDKMKTKEPLLSAVEQQMFESFGPIV